MKGLKNISYLIVRKRWFFLVIIIFIMDFSGNYNENI